MMLLCLSVEIKIIFIEKNSKQGPAIHCIDDAINGDGWQSLEINGNRLQSSRCLPYFHSTKTTDRNKKGWKVMRIIYTNKLRT